MNQEIYQYLYQLQEYIKNQDKRIYRLETLIREQKKEIDEIKARPPIQVDRIEYKFDQLKVESLEGTLNIGLNPTDLQDIGDFAVENKGISTPPINPKRTSPEQKDLETRILEYMETEMPEKFKETTRNLGKPLDENYIEFVKNDIRKQLPGRMNYYLTQSNYYTLSEEAQKDTLEKIFLQIREDIDNSILAFIQNFPNEMKE